MNLKDRRDRYDRGKLLEEDLESEPMLLFSRWFDAWLQSGAEDPTAMVLSTSGPDAFPSSRVVLLKGIDDRGFLFFTNYESQKGLDIEANPRAALLFYWPGFHRQVRVRGAVGRLPRSESDEYFESRPLESRVSAAISPQSRVVPGRQWLEEKWDRLFRGIQGAGLKRPDNWGGYVLFPEEMEFWQGREDRLHDRFLYTRKAGGWQVDRLGP